MLLAALYSFVPWGIKEDKGAGKNRGGANQEEYKIGFITDIHSQRYKKRDYDISDNSKKIFEYAANHFNKVFHPNIVVQNGDLIEGTERRGQKSVDDFLKVKEYFDKIIAVKLHVIGNHETRGLSKEEWIGLTGNNKPFYYHDLGRMRIIVMDGNEEHAKLQKPVGNYYYVSDEQIQWLEKTLEDSINFRYRIVFIHYPLLETQITSSGKNINPEDLKKINDTLIRYKVDAVFSGHEENLRFNKIDKISYFLLPGVKKSNRWFDCFYEIYTGDEIKVIMYYKKNPEQEKYEVLAIPSEEFDRIEK